jgi:hypothetical protein
MFAVLSPTKGRCQVLKFLERNKPPLSAVFLYASAANLQEGDVFISLRTNETAGIAFKKWKDDSENSHVSWEGETKLLIKYLSENKGGTGRALIVGFVKQQPTRKVHKNLRGALEEITFSEIETIFKGFQQGGRKTSAEKPEQRPKYNPRKDPRQQKMFPS